MSFLDSMWNASVKEKVDGKSVVEALTLRRLPWFLRQCVELLDQTNPSKTPSSNLLLLDSVVCTATATLDPSLPPAPAKAAGVCFNASIGAQLWGRLPHLEPIR